MTTWVAVETSTGWSVEDECGNWTIGEFTSKENAELFAKAKNSEEQEKIRQSNP